VLSLAAHAAEGQAWEPWQKEIAEEHWVYTKKFIETALGARTAPEIKARVDAAYSLALNTDDVDERLGVQAYLGEVAEQIAGWLREEPEFWVRYYLLDALGQIDAPSARTAALTYIRDPDPSLRAVSAQHVGDHLSAEAETLLIEVYSDEDEWWVRTAILDSLGAGSNPGSLALLQEALSDPVRDVRAAAAMALARRPHSSSVAPLTEAAENAELFGKDSPLIALAEIPDVDIKVTLEKGIRSPSPFVRSTAAKAIAKLPHQEGLSLLEPMLGDASAFVRQAAAESITTLGGRHAAEAVVLWLAREPNDSVFARLLWMDKFTLRDACAGLQAVVEIMEGIARTCDEIEKHMSDPQYVVVSTGDLHSWFYSSYNADAREVAPARGRAVTGWTIAVGKGTGRERISLKRGLRLTNWLSEAVRYNGEVWLNVKEGPYGKHAWVRESDLRSIPLRSLAGQQMSTNYGGGSVLRISGSEVGRP